MLEFGLVEIPEKLEHIFWLSVYHLLYHLKNVIGEFENSFRDLPHNQTDNQEQILRPIQLILLDQVHQGRYNHWYVGHAVFLAPQDVVQSI